MSTELKNQFLVGTGVAIGSIIFARFIRPHAVKMLGV